MSERSILKPVKQLIFILGIALMFIFVFENVAFAMESKRLEKDENIVDIGNIYVENEKTGEISKFPINFLKSEPQLQAYGDDDSITESYEAILEIDRDGNASVVDHVPPITRAEASSSDSNTYWKATISITYSVNAATANLTRVSGSWVQLRGNTTLSDRYVYYAINGGNVGNSGEQRPGSNTFSYNTGFNSISSGRLYSIGANSRATVTTEAGLQLRLETNVEKRYTS